MASLFDSILMWLPESSGSLVRNGRWILLKRITGLFMLVRFYDMGPTALLPLRRKWCSGFLSPLKIHRPRSGSNPRTLGPVASTLITSPPRATMISYYMRLNLSGNPVQILGLTFCDHFSTSSCVLHLNILLWSPKYLVRVANLKYWWLGR
jgi:hypothetical protein